MAELQRERERTYEGNAPVRPQTIYEEHGHRADRFRRNRETQPRSRAT